LAENFLPCILPSILLPSLVKLELHL
jgi:hypothetical protein